MNAYSSKKKVLLEALPRQGALQGKQQKEHLKRLHASMKGRLKPEGIAPLGTPSLPIEVFDTLNNERVYPSISFDDAPKQKKGSVQLEQSGGGGESANYK
jgi:hypothetical protein